MTILFFMSSKNNQKSTAIIIAMSVLALALVTATSFNHSYIAFAVSKKTSPKSGSGLSTLGEVPTSSSSSSSSATTPNSNTLTKKQLSSFTSCITTANKSAEGLTHKIVTNCLDTAKGLTSTTAASSSTTKGSSSSLSLGPSTISKS
jgi:hypothetical protein